MKIAGIDGQGGRFGQGSVEQMTAGIPAGERSSHAAGRMIASDENPAVLLRDAIDNEKKIAGAP